MLSALKNVIYRQPLPYIIFQALFQKVIRFRVRLLRDCAFVEVIEVLVAFAMWFLEIRLSELILFHVFHRIQIDTFQSPPLYFYEENRLGYFLLYIHLQR